MRLLTKAEQNDMGRQVSIKSRDIDICLYNALDGSLPKDMLLDCLMLYQNKDGGFGHGLYIDNYNVNSSPYQIYEAFRLMDLLDFDSSCENELYDEIVNRACNYLYNRIPPINGLWDPNVKTNNDYAHSEEFEFCEENTKLFGMHPTIALLGYTLVFCKPTKAYYKKALKYLEPLLKKFYEKEELTKYEIISFNSLLHSLKKANLLVDDQNKIEEKLTAYVKKVISNEFDNVKAMRPLEVALYLDDSQFDDLKNQELDYLIGSIAKHGMWDHLGGWGYDKYAEEDSAKLKWIGAGTVNNYFLLKKYGRLE